MFRRTAFGIALSLLVLGSGLTTIPVPGHTSTKKTTGGQTNLNTSNLLTKLTIFYVIRIATEWYFTLYKSEKSLQNSLIT